MKKTDNIYIDSLTFGVSKMDTGISYIELKEHLQQIGWKFENDFEDYFKYWFYSNFYCKEPFQLLRIGNYNEASSILSNINRYENRKCLITANAFKTFQDFEKLKQAKIDTKKAHNLSMWAIGISGGFALIQILIEFCK
jgi:hypothetical protein